MEEEVDIPKAMAPQLQPLNKTRNGFQSHRKRLRNLNQVSSNTTMNSKTTREMTSRRRRSHLITTRGMTSPMNSHHPILRVLSILKEVEVAAVEETKEEEDPILAKMSTEAEVEAVAEEVATRISTPINNITRTTARRQ